MAPDRADASATVVDRSAAVIGAAVAVAAIIGGDLCSEGSCRGWPPWCASSWATAVARARSVVSSVAFRYTFDLAWPLALVVAITFVAPVVETGGPSRWVWSFTVGFACRLPFPPSCRPAIGRATPEGVRGQRHSRVLAAAGWSVAADAGVPPDLIDPVLMRDYANSEVVLLPEPGAPPFADHVADELFGFAADGHLARQDVAGPRALPGPDPDCGYRVSDVPRELPFDGSLIAWPFYARIAYFSGSDTELNLAVGGQIHTVPLRSGGLSAVYLPVSGPGDSVLVSLNTPGAAACVTELRIGNRQDAATGEQVPLPLPASGNVG